MSVISGHVNVRHKAQLYVYSLVCSNLSQTTPLGRKHYYKYFRCLTKKQKCRQIAQESP